MEKIVIIDFGSQYTRLLAKKVREFEVYSEVFSPEEFEEKIKSSDIDFINSIKGVILSGGPGSVFNEKYNLIENFIKNNKNTFLFNSIVKQNNDILKNRDNKNYNNCNKIMKMKKLIPLLGICYGMQLISKVFKGEVKKGDIQEYGDTEIRIMSDFENSKNLNKNRKINTLSIFYNIPEKINVWMSHGDSVLKQPDNFEIKAISKNNLIAGFENFEKKIYALQFHPEVSHTQSGENFIFNFVFNICKCRKNWDLKSIVEKEVKNIKDIIGNKKAIIALSGGVDSSVAAIISYKAIGRNLKAIFVDHGLLRLGEVEEVKKIFGDLLGSNLKIVDAKNIFLNALKNVEDPEKKRKIIGEKFIRVFESEAKKRENIKYLIQGTIYSDVIESAASGKKTAKIKSHHNVGGLPEKLDLKIVEPLKYLFKDEVRKVGKYLGIPEFIINRHPFPGPGLAIRIIGEVTENKLNILKKADKIFIDTLKEKGWYYKIWQAFAVLTSVKSVGVVGDNRKYGYVLALRAVNSIEGMTANWSDLPYNLLAEVSNRITNSIPEIGRVVYDISSKPPATIEWE